MKIEGRVIGLMVVWYAGVTFWLWSYVRMLRSGDAGSSGMSLRRDEHRFRFWIRAAWEGAWLISLALIPLAVVLRKYWDK